jgi:hypothetical protein
MRRRLHDDASLLPTESSLGDFPNNHLRLFHFKTKSLADTLWKLQRKTGVNAGVLVLVKQVLLY